MSWFKPQTLLDKVFEGSILLKGLTAVFEFLGGLLLFFFDPRVIHDFLVAVTQKELIEDPHDLVANFLLNSTKDLGGTSKTFLIVYLWIHAAVKLVAVIGLLRNQMWAYPFSLITLGILMLYQIYHIVFVRVSIGMILLTLFDAFILWLIWREWQKHQDVQNTT